VSKVKRAKFEKKYGNQRSKTLNHVYLKSWLNAKEQAEEEEHGKVQNRYTLWRAAHQHHHILGKQKTKKKEEL